MDDEVRAETSAAKAGRFLFFFLFPRFFLPVILLVSRDEGQDEFAVVDLDEEEEEDPIEDSAKKERKKAAGNSNLAFCFG